MFSKVLKCSLGLFFVLQLVSGAAIPVAAPIKRATVCNGDGRLCDRMYSNVTHIGSHNSYAVSDQPWALSRNQEVDITIQLSMGIRLLQAQGRMWGDEMHFCHTSCLLYNGGTAADYFTTVRRWLDRNPSEVITLILTNPEEHSVVDHWKPAFEKSGLSSMIYTPSQAPLVHEWPTLGRMIETGKRVVVFLDKGADTSQVDFILPQFQSMWESPYKVTDDTFPCSVDRIEGSMRPEDHMYMINHSLNTNILPIFNGVIIPDRIHARSTNSFESIVNHARGCAPLGANRNPAFVLMDWVNIGDAKRAADALNFLI